MHEIYVRDHRVVHCQIFQSSTLALIHFVILLV